MNNEEKIIRMIEGLDAKMTGMNSDIGEIKTDVAVLKTDVAVLKTDVAELKSAMEDMTETMARRDDRLENIENQNMPVRLTRVENHLGIA